MGYEILKKKIDAKSANIGIIGLGYVGLPLAMCFAKSGFKVKGFETDKTKVKQLSVGKSYINHISDESIKLLLKKKFKATTTFSEIAQMDAIIICVPTPINIKKEPDLSYISDAINSIKNFLRQDQLISLESTTYPGTTEEKILPYIKELNLNVGKNFFLIYSPEREDPGNKKFNTKNIPKIVSGFSENCKKMGELLYKNIVDEVVVVSSLKVAEFTKLMENIHRSVNIGLVNEMKIIASKMGIDIHESIQAASTKPFGFTAYHPGPGVGGHCIPVDPYYLLWKAKKYNLKSNIIKSAVAVNDNMPIHIFKKIKEILQQKKINFANAEILLLGAAYKKNIDDIRESPTLKILPHLIKAGLKVKYSDPYIAKLSIKYNKKKIIYKSIKLNKKEISRFDLVIILTAHDLFDYKLIYENARLIADTRNVIKFIGSNVIKI